MSIFELWLLFVAIPAIGSWGTGLSILGIISAFPAIFLYIIKNDSDIVDLGISYIPFKNAAIVLIVCSALLGMLSNDKQIAFIVGGAIATNTEGVEKLPENLVKAANSFLERVQSEADGK